MAGFNAEDHKDVAFNDGSLNLTNLGDGVKVTITAVRDEVKTTSTNDAGQIIDKWNLIITGRVETVVGAPTKTKDKVKTPVQVGETVAIWAPYAQAVNGGEREKAFSVWAGAISRILKENGLTTPREGDTLVIVHHELGKKDEKKPFKQQAKLVDVKYEKTASTTTPGGFSATDSPDNPSPAVSAADI